MHKYTESGPHGRLRGHVRVERIAPRRRWWPFPHYLVTAEWYGTEAGSDRLEVPTRASADLLANEVIEHFQLKPEPPDLEDLLGVMQSYP